MSVGMAMILFLHNHPRVSSQRRRTEATRTRRQGRGGCNVVAVTNHGDHNERRVRFEAPET